MMHVKDATKRAVAFRSGNVCAKCGHELTVEYADGSVVPVGECAHIEGEHGGDPARNKPPAARYNPAMTDEERNAFPNLIYLCSGCHTEIDKIPEGERNYPVELLKQLKHDHEASVRRAMIDAFPLIGFDELAEATKWATTLSPLEPTSDYSLLEVSEKMKRNAISKENLFVIESGLSVAKEIKCYIDNVAKVDPTFPERLRDGFLKYYHEFRHNGSRGDDLFESMCQLAQRGLQKQVERTAGLAVLVYMFESCEVFEK